MRRKTFNILFLTAGIASSSQAQPFDLSWHTIDGGGGVSTSAGGGFTVSGTILGNLPGHEDAPPIALTGRVWVHCDSSGGAIEPGDLLTTSDTPGRAMKVTDFPRAQGAIIGKAMTSLGRGEEGLVLVLVSLQ